MLCCTRHYKDTIQERLTILYHFVTNLLTSYVQKIVKIELGLTKLLQ